MSAQSNALSSGLARYFAPGQLRALAAARVTIAGCGGLGSNVALLLARSGVEHMVLVDHDVVDASNLNRQQFWPEDVGQPKAEALASRLRQLNPDMRLDVRHMRITASNLPDLAAGTVLVEALDDATAKAMLVDAALGLGVRVVAASGIAGCGGPAMRVRHLGRLALVGDGTSDVADLPPLAPRVTQAAAMMADVVLGWILDGAE